MIGVGATPLVIHQRNTLDICGNNTYTPTPTPGEYVGWRDAVHSQLFTYVVAQAALTMVLFFVILFGETCVTIFMLIVQLLHS